MQHRPLVFLDVETTGLSHLDGQVLEIGAIRVEGGQVVKKFSKLLKPASPVPYFITRLTGIDDRMVIGAPTFGQVASELSELLDGAVFVAHNVSFDYNFIKMEYGRMGQKFAMDRMCTVRLSRALYPKQYRHSLDALIQAHGFKVASRHRAYDDALVLFEFFQKAIQEHGLDTFAAMNRSITLARQ